MAIMVHSAEGDEAELNTTINTTPLVDVMLVLLIIFLITVPVVLKADSGPAAERAQHPDGHQAGEYRDRRGRRRKHLLEQRPHRAERTQGPFRGRAAHAQSRMAARFPEVHIRGDKDVRFEAIGTRDVGVPASRHPESRRS